METKRQLHQNQTTHAKQRGAIKLNCGRNHPRPNNTIIHIKNKSRLRIRTDEKKRDKPTMYFCDKRGKI